MTNDPPHSADSESVDSRNAPEFPNQFCPVCSSRLQSHRCKMVCRRCGYFMSCSEFD
jgi:ribosomal protein S27AE